MITAAQVGTALDDLRTYLEEGCRADEAFEQVSSKSGVATHVLKSRFERAYGDVEQFRQSLAARREQALIGEIVTTFKKKFQSRFIKCDQDYRTALSEKAFLAEHRDIEDDVTKLQERSHRRRRSAEYTSGLIRRFRVRRWKAALQDLESGFFKGMWLARD